jgi:hypothetical protein
MVYIMMRIENNNSNNYNTSLCAIFFLVYGSSAASLIVYAQSDLQTIKHRNLVIDLGNGVKTNAQLRWIS